MLFIFGIVLFSGWLISLSGLFPGGDLRHVLLLAGLTLLLLAFAKGREAARNTSSTSSRVDNHRALIHDDRQAGVSNPSDDGVGPTHGSRHA